MSLHINDFSYFNKVSISQIGILLILRNRTYEIREISGKFPLFCANIHFMHKI